MEQKEVSVATTVDADKEKEGCTEDMNDIMKHFLLKIGFENKKKKNTDVYYKECFEC